LYLFNYFENIFYPALVKAEAQLLKLAGTPFGSP